VPGVVPPQVQDPALAFGKLHKVPLCSTLQPVQVTLKCCSHMPEKWRLKTIKLQMPRWWASTLNTQALGFKSLFLSALDLCQDISLVLLQGFEHATIALKLRQRFLTSAWRERSFERLAWRPAPCRAAPRPQCSPQTTRASQAAGASTGRDQRPIGSAADRAPHHSLTAAGDWETLGSRRQLRFPPGCGHQHPVSVQKVEICLGILHRSSRPPGITGKAELAAC